MNQEIKLKVEKLTKLKDQGFQSKKNKVANALRIRDYCKTIKDSDLTPGLLKFKYGYVEKNEVGIEMFKFKDIEIVETEKQSMQISEYNGIVAKELFDAKDKTYNKKDGGNNDEFNSAFGESGDGIDEI